jgi:hypothetical protein
MLILKICWYLALHLLLAESQRPCYVGPGLEYRAPAGVVPCVDNDEDVACCLLGDICLSGNTCWNYDTGDLYQYGCTDITYEDSTCPYKCGWNPGQLLGTHSSRGELLTKSTVALSPWVALEYCVDSPGINNTWVCHSPESCGCDWPGNLGAIVLQPRQCKDMGDDARVALYAPSTMAPYVSLPTTYGGSTGYISTTTINGTATWESTVAPGCKYHKSNAH